MERLKNWKLVTALAVAALAIVVFIQNGTLVNLRILWLASVQTSIATAMLGAFAAGFVTGALAFSRWKTQRERARATGGA